ncbi:serine protease [Mycolicibacterium sp. P1-18]|uniref:S8 family serine peptidase n=1 Tax=Mycolicibacterium sp. P1-18 TaxID=2024615 RepID=UPI0011F1DDF1|nr:S8 family serine peptidase [Mycolicibacterium sp. P1-18]KAA0096008.1 serine protease [Mycolicibacterium sp. P1-18]
MTTIARNMSELGFAPVIAVLARGADDVAAVGKHFSAQRSSQFGSASLTEKRNAGAARPRADGARGYRNLGVVYGTVDREGLAALRADPTVRRVTAAPEFSLIRPVAKASAVLPETNTWGLEAMEVPALWAEGLTGKGVRVAHLDTGVDATHPALRTAVVEFAEFDRAGRARPGAEPYDSDAVDGHGTHTAATIAGRPVRGRHIGVAPAASLYSAMVIEGGDIVARVLGGMDWAVGEKARVLSMSLGIRGIVTSFLDIVDVLRSNGVLPVVAVGNEGPGTSRSPGNYPSALSVGAHDDRFAVAEFSSSQRFVRRSQPLVPDVVSPGVDVVSAAPQGRYQSLSGTSMATPHVAGLAALLIEAQPDVTVDRLERAIFASARPGQMDVERVNRGAVNATRALAALRGE